jgi:hypothetical protein
VMLVTGVISACAFGRQRLCARPPAARTPSAVRGRGRCPSRTRPTRSRGSSTLDERTRRVSGRPLTAVSIGNVTFISTSSGREPARLGHDDDRRRVELREHVDRHVAQPSGLRTGRAGPTARRRATSSGARTR